MGTKTVMTVEQFAQMNTTDLEDFELIDGELVALSSGTPRHNKIRDLIGHLLWFYFRENPIGEALAENDCQLSLDTVRRSDLSIFLGERMRQLDLDKILAPFAPDIAVEVLSTSKSAVDVRRKVRDYLRAGSQEVWLVDYSNGEVMIHSSAGIRILQGTDVLESSLLPGFGASVGELLVI